MVRPPGAAVRLAAAVALLVALPAHASAGEYLWFADAEYPPSYRVRSDGGVTVDYGTVANVNPTTTAQWGLSAVSRHTRTGDPADLRRARRAGRWLQRNQTRAGSWRYPFPWRVGGGETLPAGWVSALAQGQAISLFTRLHAVTKDRSYLRSARKALRPFTVPVSRGGVRTRAFGGPWYEEYPTRQARSLVLNGFMFALIGLHDLARQSSRARRLFDQAFAVLPRALRRFDDRGWSLYATAPDSGGRRWLASAAYHEIHVRLLRALNAIRPDGRLRYYAARWSRARTAAAR